MFGRIFLERMPRGQPDDHGPFNSKKNFVCVQERARKVSRMRSYSDRRKRFQSSLAGIPKRTSGVCWGKLEINWINGYHSYFTHEVGKNTVT